MKKKKAAAAAVITAATVAGIVTGTVFDSPADLVPEATVLQQQTEDDGSSAAPQERQRGPVAKLREWVLSWPAAVRLLVAVPLWCLGSLLLSAVSVLWAGASPWAARLLGWLSLAVVLLAVFALSVKAAFPTAPFRRILRLRNVASLALLSALLCAADLALPTVWEGYDAVSRTVWRVGAACLLAVTCWAELRHQGKQAARTRPQAPTERTAIEEEARRLADTVCDR